jgi:hypothetical protein
MSDVYITKFWNNTHPVVPKLKEIQERYFPRGESKVYLSRVKAANPKIKQLRELIHKHYRFYNDGDSFRIAGLSAGYKKTPRDKWGNPLYIKPYTNQALKMLEDKIASLTILIYRLTADERSRPVDQYGRIHRPKLPSFL